MKKLFSVAFCVVIAVMLLASALTFLIMRDDSLSYIWGKSMIDEARALFQERGTLVQALKKDLEHPRVSLRRYKAELERAVTEDNTLRNEAVLLKNVCDRFIWNFNQTTSMQGTATEGAPLSFVVKQDNGDLTFLVPNTDISENMEKARAFGQKMMGEGRDFLFYLPPIKNLMSPVANGELFIDYSWPRQEYVLDFLKENSIDYLDMTSYFHENAGSDEQLFFHTDHHWTPQTGLIGCRELANYFNRHYGYSMDTGIFDLENYEVTYNDIPGLGSLGVKVTKLYAEPEYMPILTPRYPSDLDVDINDGEIVNSGAVEDSLFCWDNLKDSNLFTAYHYDFYGYGDRAKIQIHNNLSQDGKRVLFIKESYADCMIPYFANVCEYLDVIDLRYYFDDLGQFIEETNPDTVVLIYGIAGLDSTYAFQFGEE